MIENGKSMLKAEWQPYKSLNDRAMKVKMEGDAWIFYSVPEYDSFPEFFKRSFANALDC